MKLKKTSSTHIDFRCKIKLNSPQGQRNDHPKHFESLHQCLKGYNRQCNVLVFH